MLRAIQEREVERVGGNETIKIDVRIIAATNRNLNEMVKQGKFREDLFYRLNVVPLHVPPLRERPEDIPLLVDYFIKKTARAAGCAIPLITQEARELLRRYSWPGNVRELQNLVERLVILATGEVLQVEDLPEYILNPETDNTPPAIRPVLAGHGEEAPANAARPPVRKFLRDMEREQVESALIRNGWVQSRAARELGLTQRQMGYRIKKYALRLPSEHADQVREG